MPSKIGNMVSLYEGQISVVLPNGNFIMEYTNGTDEVMQMINMNAEFIGTPIQAYTIGIVTVLSNGNFLVRYKVSAYNDYSQIVDENGIWIGNPIPGYVLDVLSNGNLVISATQNAGLSYSVSLTDSTGGLISNLLQSADRVSTQLLMNGNFMFSYRSNATYYAHVVDTTGNFLGSQITWPATTSTSAPLVTNSPTGNFILSYGDNPNCYAQVMSNVGVLLRNIPSDFFPRPIVLSNGNFVLNYKNNSIDYVQVVAINGSLIGIPLQIAGTPIQTYLYQMTALSNDNFVISSGNSSNYNTAQLVSSSGLLIGDPIPCGSSNIRYVRELSNGNFLVACQAGPYYTQFVNANGILVSGPNAAFVSSVTSLSNQYVVVTYQSGSTYFASVINSTLAILSTLQSGTAITITVLPNANFLATYSNSTAFYIQNINVSGGTLGNPLSFSTNPSLVTVLSNSTVLVVYKNVTNYFGQLFNLNMSLISTPFQTEEVNRNNVWPFQLSDNYLLITCYNFTHENAQIYYIGKNLTVNNAIQQLNYFQDAQSANLNKITILTKYNIANATLMLSDPQAGILTTASSKNVVATYDSSLGIWQAVGDVNDINFLLNTTQFIPAPNYVNNFTVKLNIKDESNQFATGTLNWTGVPTPPSLKNNTLTIQEGRSIIFDQSQLGILPSTRPVTFNISNLQGGYFEHVNNTGNNIFQFTQAAINARQIRFVSNRKVPVSYDVSTNDGRFTLIPESANVTFINHAPIVLIAPGTEVVTVEQAFQFDLSANQIFNDTDEDLLTYSAQLADGSVLPNWLKFNVVQQNTLAFSGIASTQGSKQISLIATDPIGANVSTQFEILAVPNNGTNIFSTASTEQIAGGVIGGILGLAAIVGTTLGIGFWKKNKDSRSTEQFADLIRSTLNLKGVDNFDTEAGQRFVSMIHNLESELNKAGINNQTMQFLERQQLAQDVAAAAHNKISPATDCFGRSTITVDDLQNKLQDLVTEVQILRGGVQIQSYTTS